MQKQRTNLGNLQSYVFFPFVLITIALIQALLNGTLTEKYWLYLLYLPIAGAVLLVERRRQKSGVQLAYRHTYGMFATGLYGFISLGSTLWPTPRAPGLHYDTPPSTVETVMYSCISCCCPCWCCSPCSTCWSTPAATACSSLRCPNGCTALASPSPCRRWRWKSLCFLCWQAERTACGRALHAPTNTTVSNAPYQQSAGGVAPYRLPIAAVNIHIIDERKIARKSLKNKKIRPCRVKPAGPCAIRAFCQ